MPEARDDIDPDQVEMLAFRGWSTKEIGDFYECTDRTIRNRFSAILAKGRTKRRGELRDAQWKSAVTNGNVTMQIWLGKQELSQSEYGQSTNDEELAPFTENDK